MPDSPIYRELAHTWRAAGRSVPGEPDPAWDLLAAPPGRHRAPAPRNPPRRT